MSRKDMREALRTARFEELVKKGSQKPLTKTHQKLWNFISCATRRLLQEEERKERGLSYLERWPPKKSYRGAYRARDSMATGYVVYHSQAVPTLFCSYCGQQCNLVEKVWQWHKAYTETGTKNVSTTIFGIMMRQDEALGGKIRVASSTVKKRSWTESLCLVQEPLTLGS